MHSVAVGDGLAVVVGAAGLVLEGDRHGWRRIDTGVTDDLYAVAHAEHTWFAVGPPGVMLLRKEGEWYRRPLPSGARLRGAWAGSATHALFVGEGGTVLRWRNGAARREVSGTQNTLRAVWGLAGGVAYAVGDDGTVLSFDGSQWRDVRLPTQGTLLGAWGPSDGSGSMWIVGLDSHAYRYSGGLWNAVPTDGSNLMGIWGSSSSDVYAVGGAGRILHFDGVSWSRERLVRDELLWAVSGKGDFVVAVSSRGKIVQRQQAGWETTYELPAAP